MLQIGICDDMADARMMLRAAIERLVEARSIQARIFEFSSGEGLLGWFQKHKGELDLVFLDIELNEMDGMETARRLRNEDAGLQLVFVTGYADYVYDGYAVGALGYLIKPPKALQLEDVLTRALAALHRDADEVFVCRSSDSFFRIQRREILYFASDRRVMSCVTALRTYTFYGKLDEVESALGDESFVRIHQRYLVNAAAVERVDSCEVSVGGQSLPISRSCQSSALLALTRAMLK